MTLKPWVKETDDRDDCRFSALSLQVQPQALHSEAKSGRPENNTCHSRNAVEVRRFFKRGSLTLTDENGAFAFAAGDYNERAIFY